MERIYLVFTNLPDRDSALALADTLVTEGAAACVNVLAPAVSIYRWKGVVERAEEVPLLIKTPAAAYGKVEEIIRRCHPYELPEIIAVPVEAGLPAYVAWVAAETPQQS